MRHGSGLLDHEFQAGCHFGLRTDAAMLTPASVLRHSASAGVEGRPDLSRTSPDRRSWPRPDSLLHCLDARIGHVGWVSTFGERERSVDLSEMDAKSGPGNQAFHFISTAAFTHTKGELRVKAAGNNAIVMGDVDGDGLADFEIALLGFTDLANLTAVDFKL
jgi:hypothetical protein